MTATLIAMAMASAFLHAVWNTLAKKAGGDSGTLWLGQLLTALISFPVVLWRVDWGGIDFGAMSYLAATGLNQAVYFLLLGKAYEKGDISVVYPVARGGCVALVGVSSVVLLQETFTLAGALGVLAVCVGTTLMGLGGNKADSRRSIAYALAVAGCLAMGSMIDNVAVGRLDPLFYIWCLFVLGTSLQLPFMLARKRPEMSRAWRERKVLGATIGLVSMGSYLIVLYAFREGPVAYIVAMRESSVVFGAAMGVFVLKETVTRQRMAGVAAIVAGLICLRLA
jgi:drug/metabolite transporter (DMT)-like permease